ncbi:MAG: hypothetical protein DRJ42_04395 [Deltaproteobacteria bacterium]|nr:MAG: hypothetical protein DRJ42_04395 [Deltaproteobacteria bacterium]
MRFGPIHAGAVFAALMAVGCSGAAPGPHSGAPVPAVRSATYLGRVTYEARTPTPTGASRRTVEHPAPRVVVLARDAEGHELSRTVTDDDGRFRIEAPTRGARLVVLAQVTVPDLRVTTDSVGEHVHEREVELSSPDAPVQIVAREEDADGFGGALHIVATLLRGVDTVTGWTGETLPPLFVHWGRGVTSVWSFYHGERPEGSGRYALELMGGDPGAQRTSDTDEHDEAIVLHELGHFVMDMVTGDSSPGGDHPTGYLLDPGLAWEEGRATWFAAAVLGPPLYWDTIGIEPQGRLRVSHDLERGGAGVRGLGSEMGVAEILWDLADGSGGLDDVDQDGVALGAAGVLEAMAALAEEPGSFPCIATFLRFVVDQGTVSEDAVRDLLLRGGHPSGLLPAAGEVLWPTDLAVPGQVSDKVDGLTDPAPSGGGARPQNGFDALRVYRVHVPHDAWLTVSLQVHGSGRGSEHQDADLELRDRSATLLASSRSEEPRELIEQAVDAGYYIIYVRDGGQGNRVGFTLSVSARAR